MLDRQLDSNLRELKRKHQGFHIIYKMLAEALVVSITKTKNNSEFYYTSFFEVPLNLAE